MKIITTHMTNVSNISDRASVNVGAACKQNPVPTLEGRAGRLFGTGARNVCSKTTIHRWKDECLNQSRPSYFICGITLLIFTFWSFS